MTNTCKMEETEKRNIHGRRLAALAAAHAVFVVIMCYFAANVPFQLGGEASVMRWIDVVGKIMTPPSPTVPDSVVAVNIAYDKQLVDYNDEYGMPLGTVDITDRAKLLRILSMLDSIGTYRYVMLDVGFDSEYRSESDSALFALISRMPRIVVPRHRDMSLPPQLETKATAADYRTRIGDNDFAKYPIFDLGHESMPLRMWRELTGGTYDAGLVSFADGTPAFSTIFLTLPVRFNGMTYEADGNKTMYNLGVDLLDPMVAESLPALVDGKYIFFGDFVDRDMHSTYAGEMPGTIINLNAFVALMQGRHIVSWVSMLVLWVMFFLASVSTFSGRSLIDYIPGINRLGSGLVKLLVSWTGYSVVFTVVFSLFFMVRGEVYDILFISTYFTILSSVIEQWREKREHILAVASKFFRKK